MAASEHAVPGVAIASVVADTPATLELQAPQTKQKEITVYVTRTGKVYHRQIASVTPNPATLWPPDNRFMPVSLTVSAWDAVDASPTCAIANAASSEPGSGDWSIIGASTVELRAARSRSGPGRTYTITIACTDDAGNRSMAAGIVTVPHDRRPGP